MLILLETYDTFFVCKFGVYVDSCESYDEEKEPKESTPPPVHPPPILER